MGKIRIYEHGSKITLTPDFYQGGDFMQFLKLRTTFGDIFALSRKCYKPGFAWRRNRLMASLSRYLAGV